MKQYSLIMSLHKASTNLMIIMVFKLIEIALAEGDLSM